MHAAPFPSSPDEIRQGTIEKIDCFQSKTSANNRDLYIYLPPSYAIDPARRFPVLYAMDGQSVFDLPDRKPGSTWRMDYAAEKAMASGCSPEIIIVGVPSKDGDERAREYRPDMNADAFLSFLVTEVKPAIDAKYRTLPDREHTAMCGSSYGGLISTWAAVKYSKVFGQIAALSASVSWCRTQMDQAFPAMPEKVRMYFDNGTDDIGASPTDELRDREAFMAAHGYAWGGDFVTYLDSGGHHDPCFWNRRVPRVISFLFGRGTSPAMLPPVWKVSAKADASDVFLTWTPAYGALAYNILRAGTGGVPVAIATAITSPYYLDRSLPPGQTYSYSVVSVNGGGQGPASAAVSIAPATTSDILIPDSDFQIPRVGPGVHLFDVTGGCWAFSSDAGLATAGSFYTQKSPRIPAGQQVAMLRRQSVIGQVLHGFKPGASYVLTLSAAQCGFKSIQKQIIQVMIDDRIVGVFLPPTTEFTSFSTKPFVAKAADQILRIAGMDAQGDNTALIDAVRIHEVPVALMSAEDKTALINPVPVE